LVQSNGFLQTRAKSAKGLANKRSAEKEQISEGQDRKAQMPIDVVRALLPLSLEAHPLYQVHPSAAKFA
jgi:hypothetical protein